MCLRYGRSCSCSRNFRNFRNKGVDVTYNPEFNTYRLYQAYSDYNDLTDLTEDLIFSIVKYIIGRLPSTPKAVRPRLLIERVLQSG